MEVIEEHLRSCLGVIRKPLAYDIMKTIIVQVYGYYPMHATPCQDVRLATRQEQTLSKGRCSINTNAYSRVQDRHVYDILDQICMYTDLYPYVKQLK